MLLIPPLARDRKLRLPPGFLERRRLRRLADDVILPGLLRLVSTQVQVEVPDQGATVTGRMRSVRRSQLCFEIVLNEAQASGRLRVLVDGPVSVVVIRPV